MPVSGLVGGFFNGCLPCSIAPHILPYGLLNKGRDLTTVIITYQMHMSVGEGELQNRHHCLLVALSFQCHAKTRASFQRPFEGQHLVVRASLRTSRARRADGRE